MSDLKFNSMNHESLERHRRKLTNEISGYLRSIQDPGDTSTVDYYKELQNTIKIARSQYDKVMGNLVDKAETDPEAHRTQSAAFLNDFVRLRALISAKILNGEMPEPLKIIKLNEKIVNQISDYCQEKPEEAPAVYQRRRDQLEDAGKAFNTAYTIESKKEKTDQEARQLEDMRLNFVEAYEMTIARIENLIVLAQKRLKEPLQQEDVKLPKVTIPTFDGTQSSWFKFRDTFERAVHKNKSINNMTKFTMLTESYQPKETNCLDGFSICAEQYEAAWTALKARYDDDLKLREYYLSKLTNVKKATQASTSELHRIHDTFTAIVTGLRQTQATFDHYLVYCVEATLDRISLKDWSDFIGKEDPSWDKMCEFLNTQAKKVSSHSSVTNQTSTKSSPQQQSNTQKPRNTNYDRKNYSKAFSAVNSESTDSTYQSSCVLCQQNHPLYKCPTFNQMTVDERNKVIRKHNRCLNCLSTGHGVRNCSSKSRCRHCTQNGKPGNHHTLLHIDFPDKNKSFTSNHGGNSHGNSVLHPSQEDSPQFHRFHIPPGQVQAPFGNPQPPTYQYNGPQSSSMFTHSSSQVMAPTQQTFFAHPQNQMSTSTSRPVQEFAQHGTWFNGVPNTPSSQCNHVRSLNANNPNGRIILPTVRVTMINQKGDPIQVRCLLDTGSDTCFITKRLASALGLKFNKDFMLIEGVMGNVTQLNKSAVADIHSNYGKFGASLKFMIVDEEVSSELPAQLIDRRRTGIDESLFLADPEFNLPKHVDVLLSSDLFFFCLLNRKLYLDSGAMLIESMFGWLVGGLAPPVNQGKSTFASAMSLHVSANVNAELSAQIENFIEVENIGINDASKPLSPDEKYCEEFYERSTYRAPSGHYVVTYPMKECINQLDSNISKAFQRLRMLDDRRTRDQDYSAEYSKYFDGMLADGILTEISPSLSHEGHYVCHHGVVKKSSTTTKVRPVFDGSCKAKNGLSLNDCLRNGPIVQPELFDIFLRFREGIYAATCDIEKMFLRFQIDESQRKYQKILWTPQPHGPVKHYQINSVIFGLACSSYLATRTINRIADDHADQFPHTASLMKTCFYVDDGLFSFNSIEEAIKVRDELKHLTSSAHLNLRKWSAMDIRILQGLAYDDIQLPDERMNVKVLGHDWNISNDTLSIAMKDFDTKNITKASVLSVIASFYDMFGFFGPVILTAKLFMQSLVHQQVKWDEQPDVEFKSDWIEFVNELKLLSSITIPRSMITPHYVQVDLHGFSDASEHGYGCVIYLRSVDSEGRIKTQLVCSKSRVAPTKKKQTLARLELCGATLLARIFSRVAMSLRVKINRKFSWCDSMIVMHWINNLPSKYQTYVANRVAAIQENSADCVWKHVPGKLNPADLVSRGSWPQDLIDNELWWQPFIAQPEHTWPKSQLTVVNESSNEEWAKEIRRTHSTFNSHDIAPELINLIESRFSQYKTVLRIFVKMRRWSTLTAKRREWKLRQIRREIVADQQQMVLRSARNVKQNVQPQLETPPEFPVTPDDVDDALISIIRIVQQAYFHREYEILKNHRTPQLLELPKDTKLKSVSPYFDHDLNIIRVGGRLDHSTYIPHDQKHPMLLPDCHFSTILVEHLHRTHNHPTMIALESFVKQRFWPLNLLRTIRKVTRRCKSCFRHIGKPSNQMMAALPHARVNPGIAFQRTAVDYAGPFLLRASLTKRSSIVKCYVAVFKCMMTGAIHLELVTSLNTKSFILAFDRFVARRNLPEEIYSDNGGAFHAADKEFQEVYRECASEIADYLTYKGIRWIFTTPLAPHAGGVYEIGVKMFKHHLTRAIGDRSYDFELFYTLLCKIEADVNSRPLLAMKNDPDNMEILTPGHFLNFKEQNARPERNLIPVKEGLLTAIDRVHKARQHFWQEWSTHYLHTLQTRPKGFQDISEFKVDQLVLLIDKNASPRKWRTARIIALFPGKDGIIRNVRVKTQAGELERHVKYIVPLPVEDESPPAGTVLLNATLW